jgi:hypothetical protein
LQALAEQEETRAAEAIRAGNVAVADRALERARKLRRIAYLRAAAAAYQGDPSLNPEQVTVTDEEAIEQPAGGDDQNPNGKGNVGSTA